MILQATQHRNPMLQQHEGERDYEQDGTLTGVQNLHTKDDEEETVQEPHEHSLLESIEV